MLFNYNFFIYYSFFYFFILNYSLFIGSLITQYFDLFIYDIFNLHEVDLKFNIQTVTINPSDVNFDLLIPSKIIINDLQITNNNTMVKSPSERYNQLYTYFICIISLVNCIQCFFILYIFLIQMGKTLYRKKIFLSFFYTNLLLKISSISYFLADKPLINYCLGSSKFLILNDNDCLYDYGFYLLIFITITHLIISLLLLTKKYCSNIKINRRINSVNGNIVSENISIVYEPLLINTYDKDYEQENMIEVNESYSIN